MSLWWLSAIEIYRRRKIWLCHLSTIVPINIMAKFTVSDSACRFILHWLRKRDRWCFVLWHSQISPDAWTLHGCPCCPFPTCPNRLQIRVNMHFFSIKTLRMLIRSLFLSLNKVKISVFVLYRSDFLKMRIILNVWRWHGTWNTRQNWTPHRHVPF